MANEEVVSPLLAELRLDEPEKFEEVTFRGSRYKVVPLSPAEYDWCQIEVEAERASGKVINLTGRIVACCLRNLDGSRVFPESQLAEAAKLLGAKGGPELLAVGAACDRVSAVGKATIEEMAKNSEATPESSSIAT